MTYLCYFYNIGFYKEFDTPAEAKQYGVDAGFQFVVLEKNDENVTRPLD